MILLYSQDLSQTGRKDRIESLSPMGIRFVARLIDSLASPPHADFASTWITSNRERASISASRFLFITAPLWNLWG